MEDGIGLKPKFRAGDREQLGNSMVLFQWKPPFAHAVRTVSALLLVLATTSVFLGLSMMLGVFILLFSVLERTSNPNQDVSDVSSQLRTAPALCFGRRCRKAHSSSLPKSWKPQSRFFLGTKECRKPRVGGKTVEMHERPF